VNLTKRIEQSESLIHWLDELIATLSIPTNDRALISACCLEAALEHHRSIVLTSTASYYGTAFALVRLEFEAYVRGVWLHHCATDDQLNMFKRDELQTRFDDLISELESKEAFNVGVLSAIKHASWKAMCSFTHTGFLQVVRRISDTEIGANYSMDEILETLNFSDSIALLATVGIVGLSAGDDVERGKLAERLIERMKEFAVA